MKKAFILGMYIVVAGLAYSQDGSRLDITGFEDGLDWQFTQGPILGSWIEESALFEPGVTPKEGNASLYVDYDNAGSTWGWVQMNFPTDAIDASGMTELHMWVYWFPESVPDPTYDFNIRLYLIPAEGANVAIGTQSTTITGEWVELVWKIDSLSSLSAISALTAIGGNIIPANGDSRGTLYIDDLYFFRPAGVPDVESITVYDFNEEDPATGFVKGWTSSDGSLQPPFPGEGQVPPSEGANYMELPLGSGWVNVIHTANAQADFDRWEEVTEI
ncbi:MAG: hypothetical protein C4527_16130 [Candidatus Omnitrophota bacterium]|jgi:hypothetical protein|nr:MAG: hypothetical protein C4527_16130 [Candidatus Omnitrophota bacterium]